MPSPKRRGRPLVFGERLSGRIVIRLTPTQAADLRALAAEQKRAIADVLREAVNEFVADHGERKLFVRTRSEGGA